MSATHRGSLAEPFGQSSGWIDLPQGAQPEGPQPLPLGGGGRGRRRVVMRATGGLPERVVFLEWFSGSETQEATRRASQVRPLRHVNLVPIYQVRQVDGRGYVLSEVPDAVDLATVLSISTESGDPLPPWFFLIVLSEVARALLVLHEEASVPCHGAVHPGNIFVSWDGRVRLLSFSLLDGESAGALCGPAPEQRLSSRLWSPRVDVHALGGLLLALVPNLPNLPDWHEPLATLARQATSEIPSQRPSLLELATELNHQVLQKAPLARAEAISKELFKRCPRELAEPVAVDMQEVWNEIWAGPSDSAPAPLPLASDGIPDAPESISELPDPTPQQRTPAFGGVLGIALGVAGIILLLGALYFVAAALWPLA